MNTDNTVDTKNRDTEAGKFLDTDPKSVSRMKNESHKLEFEVFSSCSSKNKFSLCDRTGVLMYVAGNAAYLIGSIIFWTFVLLNNSFNFSTIVSFFLWFNIIRYSISLISCFYFAFGIHLPMVFLEHVRAVVLGVTAQFVSSMWLVYVVHVFMTMIFNTLSLHSFVDLMATTLGLLTFVIFYDGVALFNLRFAVWLNRCCYDNDGYLQTIIWWFGCYVIMPVFLISCMIMMGYFFMEPWDSWKVVLIIVFDIVTIILLSIGCYRVYFKN